MKKKSISRSAFFNSRVLIGFGFCLIGVVLALLGSGLYSRGSALAQAPAQVPAEYRGLAPVVKFDVSPALRDITPIAPTGPCTLRENEDRDIVPRAFRFGFDPDPVVQSSVGLIEIPPPIVTFDGPPNLCGCAPPDPNGAVGPNHIVVMDNLSFQIFNKTGTSLFGPAANNTLFAGFGGPCQTENAGDPVVLYDKLANRWLLSQFTANGPTYFNCVAVSTGPDPTGTYNRYAISTGSNFPDYPKYGIGPDAYYISTREFAGGTSFAGVGAYAINRLQVLAGNPNPQVIQFLQPPGAMPYNVGDGLLPADFDGVTLPPAGSPEYYLGSMDNNGPYGAPQDALTLYKFIVNFANPPASSFALANTIPTSPFNSILGLCGGSRACIPQPGTTNKIDHLGYRQRPLHRLAYRNFGTHESLVTNQSVSGGTGPAGEVSGIRWWELRSPNSSPVIFQEGTYSPGVTDGIHRWMGSIAMDSQGNMALGFSASNSTVFPSVYYTGRNANSPLGTMPLGEASIINGTGSQTAGGNRWGDYTALSLDPVDDLTFWYVNEYVPTTSPSGWRLRVGSFRIAPLGPTPTATATSTGTPSPTPTATATIPPTPTPTPTVTPTPSPCGVAFMQNFDGVVAPALPAGWTTAATGVEVPWVTSTNNPASAPNDAFAPDVTNIGNTELITPTIVAPVGGGLLTFRNVFNMEFASATVGYDGMVLEISIAGGAYADILAAGGSFVTGGYTHTISTGFMSPIAGRMAWSGVSGGTTAAPTYITTTVNLPAAAGGQNIQLKWRAATDNSVAAAGDNGVRVDNIVISYKAGDPEPNANSDNWRNAITVANLRGRRDSRSLGYRPGGSTAPLPLWWRERRHLHLCLWWR